MFITNCLLLGKMREKVHKIILSAFTDAISSVKPSQLIKKNFKFDKSESKLRVFDDSFDVKNKEIYLVGAGKAVLQMATEVERALDGQLKSGIISIPVGIIDRFPVNSKTVIKYHEGAENNIPDAHSERATEEIKKFVMTLDEKCLLLVLLSGGGSALLPSPISPVSLQEKSNLIKDLSKAGADIVEMNTVRKRLSSIKGGKLSELAQPARVVSLLISDIVGNHSESIASGPTFENNDEPSQALRILEKYSLVHTLPSSIKHVLYSHVPNANPQFGNVNNYVLGDNSVAIEAARVRSVAEGLETIVLSNVVHGDVEDLSKDYCLLVSTLVKVISKSIEKDTAKNILKKIKNVPLGKIALKDLNELQMCSSLSGICLIAGGEPTVRVTGSGRGGRSQHLALSFSNQLKFEKEKCYELKNFDVSILCAGTDGMDGPTDAAGAIAYGDLTMDAENQNLSVESFLTNNDSYSFFKTFSQGLNHIKTGHTNTNVMDIHIIVINSK